MVCDRGHNTAIPALLDSPEVELERRNDAKHTPLMLCCLAGALTLHLARIRTPTPTLALALTLTLT